MDVGVVEIYENDEDGIVHLGLYDFLLNEDLINM